MVFVLKRTLNAPLFFSPHLIIITVKTTCHLQLLNSGRSLWRCSSFDFGQKGTKFQMRQKPNTAPRIPKGVRWTVKSFATTSQSSLNLTKLTAADHDAVGYPCKRLVPAMCSLLHNYSYCDFHSHQDPWSCTLSPHSCVVQRICRPDDRITFDTRTADECPGHDTHPRARAPC